MRHLPRSPLLLSCALLALPVAAQAAPAPAYRATLAEVPASPRAIVRDILFHCRDTVCEAAKGSGNPRLLCRGVARTFGTVTGFVAGGRAFDAEEVARCNAAG